MKSVLSKPELILKLQEEIAKIKNFCSFYDSGDGNVIRGTAQSILIIFQNTETEKSLISQLKLNHLPILSGSEIYNPKSLTNYLGLLKLEHQANKGWNYSARLAVDELQSVSQENWWQHKKIIIDSNGTAFTRSKIIKLLAKEEQLNGDQNLIANQIDTSGWHIRDIDGNKKSINPIPETTRQIAFELLATFTDLDINSHSKLHHKL